MTKLKKIAKYATNILGIIMTLVVGLDSIEGIVIPYTTQIVEICALCQGIIATYLLGGKVINTAKKKG